MIKVLYTLFSCGFIPSIKSAMILLVMSCFLAPTFLLGSGLQTVELSPDLESLSQSEMNAGPGRVKISYYLHYQPRMASNQFAIWIEDADGNYIATVFATRYTAMGGYERRPLSLPEWRRASDWGQAKSEYVDAVSGATPMSGWHANIWDCKDEHGRPVPPGRYFYRVEGNIFWENMVIWTGEIEISDSPDQSQAEPQYIPERAHRKGILLEEVRAEFTPE